MKGEGANCQGSKGGAYPEKKIRGTGERWVEANVRRFQGKMNNRGPIGSFDVERGKNMPRFRRLLGEVIQKGCEKKIKTGPPRQISRSSWI